MYSIKIMGISGEVTNEEGDVIDSSIVDGICGEEDFVDYLPENLSNLGLVDGYMTFELIAGTLWIVTEYESINELTPETLELLGKYTQGQWSDGIGEGFEQFPCMYKDGMEVYVSPYYHGQEIKIIQNKL